MITNITTKGLSAWLKVAPVGASIVLPRRNQDNITQGRIPLSAISKQLQRLGVEADVNAAIIVNPNTLETQRAIQITITEDYL